MFKLRSLSGLLAFEAAARHGSLTLAAEELGRTQSAVSQQVKALEAELGLQLFVRKPREVSLTPEGRAVAASVREAFDGIEKTVTAQQVRDEPNVLRLTTYQSFAIHWLIPRLPRFSLKYPEIDVRINADDKRLDLQAEGYDLAIRAGKLAEPKGWCQELVAPVYAPSLTDGRALMAEEALGYPLLAHADGNMWGEWLAANGVAVDKAIAASDYSHGGMLVQAALAGGGIAMAALAIAADGILSGRLHCIKGKPVTDGDYYYIDARRDPAPEKVQVFAEWFQEEMAAMETELEEFLA